MLLVHAIFCESTVDKVGVGCEVSRPVALKVNFEAVLNHGPERVLANWVRGLDRGRVCLVDVEECKKVI